MLSLRRPSFVPAILVAFALVAAPAAAVKRRAFVTSVTGQGNLAAWDEAGGFGALAAGDNICRTLAAAATEPLPNAQSYRAWLSTASTDAYCHVRGQSGKKANGCIGTAVAAGPWYRANGSTAFTGSLDELVDEDRIMAAIRTDENSVVVTGAGRIWTGTNASGENVANKNCTSWVVSADDVDGRAGIADQTAEDWTSNSNFDCSDFNHLLCLEPGASEAPVRAWSPAALVFITSAYGTGDLGAWPAAGSETGIDAGDAVCRSLAAAAHLPAPDSFVAWLSDGSTDAGDRLTLQGTPYRRVDAYGIASSKASLLSGALANSIHVDETGRYLGDHTQVWTATAPNGNRTPDHCAGWTVGDGSDEGLPGIASAAFNEIWTDFAPFDCHQPLRLYCFSNEITIFWDGFDLTEDASRWSPLPPE